MAVRVRVLHSLVLALVCLSLVVYSSYYNSASSSTPQQLPRSPSAGPLASGGPPAAAPASEAPKIKDRALRNVSILTTGQDDSLSNGSALLVGLNVSTIAEEVGAVVIGVGSVSLGGGNPVGDGDTPAAGQTSSAVSGPAAGGGPPPSLQPAKNVSATPAPAPAPVASGSAQKASATSSIQRIPPKEPANATLDATTKGIITRSIYEAGHDLPNVEICPDLGRNLQVLITITSAPNHRDARMAVRQTWGHYALRSDVAIAFMLGTTNNAELEKSLATEAAVYGDIVRGRFLDSYNNLTLKTISTLEWVDNYCSEVKFVLKTDDDMFINVPKLIAFINKHLDTKRTIYGRLAKKWKPIRNKKSKYYVSPQQYKRVVFPDFTTGPAYLMSQDVVHDLYTAALEQTYLKLEDVYTTGIVAHSINVKRVHVNEFLNKRVAFNACIIQKGISIHMVKYHEQFDLWKKLLDGRTKCK